MVDQVITIQVLPDDTLLLIFLFHRRLSCPYNTTNLSLSVLYAGEWKWHVLAHVCQRWRYLIFSSPRHLGLRLLISDRNRHRAPVDCWPPFPISIWFGLSDLSPNDEDRVIEALKHPDRIHEIHFKVSRSMLEKSTAWVEHSFPALECLFLRPSSPNTIVLPNGFLGGSTAAPRKLRHFGLSHISFPTLPQFLLSSPNLVSLELNPDSNDMGFLLTYAFLAALSATTQLEYLLIRNSKFYFSPAAWPYLEQRTAHSTPSTRDPIVLRSLIKFDFGGPSNILEDFVSRIDTPLLEQLYVYSDRLGLDIPQLSQFISKRVLMNSVPHRMSIFFDTHTMIIEYHFGHLPTRRGPILLKFDLRGYAMLENWQASHVLHICGQLSPFTSSVERLGVTVNPEKYSWQPMSSSETERDAARWMELLGSFKSVQVLRLLCMPYDAGFGIALALESSTRETAQEVLPVLRFVSIYASHCLDIEWFIAARKRTGQPITVYESDWKSDWDEPGDADN